MDAENAAHGAGINWASGIMCVLFHNTVSIAKRHNDASSLGLLFVTLRPIGVNFGAAFLCTRPEAALQVTAKHGDIHRCLLARGCIEAMLTMAVTGVGRHASWMTDRLPPHTSAIASKNPPVREFQIPATYSFPVW
jgi:hypothetical protein